MRKPDLAALLAQQGNGPARPANRPQPFTAVAARTARQTATARRAVTAPRRRAY
ncbi:hypothetical protein [Kitasatospora sp. NPDC047058]|uniref:hypothetical protein n=1 Tax=Kitasatospora sp. NPDC047058 TaxID=3155620 RepID=UPI0033F565D9